MYTNTIYSVSLQIDYLHLKEVELVLRKEINKINLQQGHWNPS